MISTSTTSAATTADCTLAQASAAVSPTTPTSGVSQVAQGISDEELELHIIDAGERMKDAMARYEVSSCFNDLADGHRWLTVMEDAIRARSPAQVARMERALGLGGAVA